jgi:hypothetical protein
MNASNSSVEWHRPEMNEPNRREASSHLDDRAEGGQESELEWGRLE